MNQLAKEKRGAIFAMASFLLLVAGQGSLQALGGEGDRRTSLCSLDEVGLRGGAFARWQHEEQGPASDVAWFDPVVLLTAAHEEISRLLVEVSAVFGSIRLQLEPRLVVLEPRQTVAIPIAVGDLHDLHPQQASVPTVVSVGVFEIDEAGAKRGRSTALDDLHLVAEARGAWRVVTPSEVMAWGRSVGEDEEGVELEPSVGLEAAEVQHLLAEAPTLSRSHWAPLGKDPQAQPLNEER